MNLLQYIKGNRKGKDVNLLEREAMNDLFLADALEGFDKIRSFDHEARIQEMHARVMNKTKSGNNRIIRYISIAASILLILGVGVYSLLNKNQSHENKNPDKTESSLYVSEQQMTENKESAPDTLQKDSLSETTIPSEKTLPLQAKIERKRVSKPAIKPKTRNDASSEAKSEIATIQANEVTMPDSTPLVEDKAFAMFPERDTIDEKDSKTLPVIRTVNRKVRRGIITDVANNPLAGASVMYSGTNTGVTSNEHGYFELPASKNDKIQIAFVGYEPVNLIADTSDNPISVVMKEDNAQLSEVVVVAFGTQKKESAVGAITTVPPSSLAVPSSSLANESAGSIAVQTKNKNNIKPKPVIGKKKYEKYLKENIVALKSDDCKKKKGKVRLKFSIDERGRPTNIRVEKSLCPEADKEAIRLIEQGPDWTMGDKEVKIKIQFK